MPYYPPQQEPYGFYNPNMAGPDWARGIGYWMGQLLERREGRRQEDEERAKWEQEQDLQRRRATAYEKSIELQGQQRGQPQRDFVAENAAELKTKYDALVPHMGEKGASLAVYGGIKPSAAGAEKPDPAVAKQEKRVEAFIKEVSGSYDAEIKRLRTAKEKIAGEDLPGGPEAIKQIDEALKNMQIAAQHVKGIAGNYSRTGNISGQELNMLRDYYMGIENAKTNPFMTSGRDQPGPMATRTPGVSPSGMAPAQAPMQDEIDTSQWPEPVRRAMEESGIPPEIAEAYWRIFTQGPGSVKKKE